MKHQKYPGELPYYTPVKSMFYQEVKPSRNPHYIFNTNKLTARQLSAISSIGSLQKDIDLDALSKQTAVTVVKRSQSSLPHIDAKIYENDINIAKMKEVLKTKMRRHELTEWADEYVPKKWRNQFTKNKKYIRDESDLLLSIKQKFIEQRNDNAARNLQKIFRGLMVRRRYIKLRNHIVKAATTIQRNFRAYQFKKKMQVILRVKAMYSAQKIQAYMRGYLVNRWLAKRRATIMAELTKQMDEIVGRHGLDLKIKLMYIWKKYKKKKAKKKKKKTAASSKTAPPKLATKKTLKRTTSKVSSPTKKAIEPVTPAKLPKEPKTALPAAPTPIEVKSGDATPSGADL